MNVAEFTPDSISPSFLSAVYEELKDLPALPVSWYSWRVRDEPLADAGFIQEYVRITGALSLSLAEGPEHWKRVLDALVKAGGTQLAVNLSPWHKYFAEDSRPFDDWTAHLAELSYQGSRFGMLHYLLRGYPSVRVGAVLLDQERFKFRWPDADHSQAWCDHWNSAVAEKMLATERTVREIWPRALMLWYNAGKRSYQFFGWEPTHYCPALYDPADLIATTRTYWQSCGRAELTDVWKMSPHVLLGGARSPEPPHAIDYGMDYPVENSYQIGRLLHQVWRSVDCGAFYPGPALPNDPKRPNWMKHFVAFVKGATDKAA